MRLVDDDRFAMTLGQAEEKSPSQPFMPANQSWIRFLPPFLRSKLEGRYTLQKIASNAGWLAADRILRMGVGLVVGVWIARYLGPEQFGLFNYAIAFVGLLSPLASLGLEGIVIRDLVKDPTCQNETLGTTVVLKFFGAIVTILLELVIITELHPADNLMQGLVAIIAAGMIFQTADAIDFWFQAQVQSQYSVIARTMAFVLVALVRVLLIHLKAPLIAFAWAGLAETGLGAIGLLIVYHCQGNRMTTWQVSLARMKGLLRDSWALVLSGIAIMIYMKIDQIMLGKMVGEKAVGIYSAATRVSEVWYFIPIAIVTSASPAIIEAKQIGQEIYHRRIQQLFNTMTVLALAIAIPITLISTPLITTLFGHTYEDAGIVLSIHIWAALFVFWGVAQSPWNLAEDLIGLSLQKTVIGAITNVALNLVLIPSYTSNGAAIATLISYAVSSSFLNLFDRRTYPIVKNQLNSFNLSQYRKYLRI